MDLKTVSERFQILVEELVREVLDTCADRLENRAKQFDKAAAAEPGEGHETMAHLLRAEAKIIRAGCHRYGDIVGGEGATVSQARGWPNGMPDRCYQDHPSSPADRTGLGG
jgi:hypothetical protein